MRLRKKSKITEYFTSEYMKVDILPTYIQVARHFYAISELNNIPLLKRIYKTVDYIINIWKSASIPIFRYQSIVNKLKSYISIITLLKKYNGKQNLETQLANHIEKYDVLFDICTCSCHLEVSPCICIRKFRIPQGKQSNIILVSEPNTEFISHVKPNGRSTAENVTNAIIESFKDVNSSNLNVLGCDGTAGNTGNKGGILARMERHLNHKCHWVVSIYY